MKNFVNTKFVIAILMVASVMMATSCQQDDEFVSSIMEEKVENSNVAARSGINPLYDFVEDSGNSSRGNSIVRSPGFVYKWKITDNSSTGTLLNPKLEFICPDGVTRYIAMTKVVGPGNVWILNQSLSQNGRYTWRYVASNNSALTSWNSYVDNIKITIGNDYPYPAGQCTPNAAGCTDKWFFYRYNCTSWVAHKVSQMWGTEKDFNNSITSPSLSHAVYWKSRLQTKGYQANNTPIVGSIAYWGASASPGVGANGHVAFVIGVTRNSSDVITSILISEYNGSNSFGYGTRTLTPGSTGYPNSFIHVQHRR